MLNMFVIKLRSFIKMVYLLTTTAVAIVNNIPCHNFCRCNVCDIILLLIEMTIIHYSIFCDIKAHLGGFELVVNKKSDVVRCRQKNNKQNQADLFPQQYPRQRRLWLAEAADPANHATAGALSKHVNAAAAYERPDVSQLAEEHVADDVAPEPDRNHVLSQQTLVAHPNVVLGNFGAKRRSNRRIEHDIS